MLRGGRALRACRTSRATLQPRRFLAAKSGAKLPARIAITGSEGRIGQLLATDLAASSSLQLITRAQVDLAEPTQTRGLFTGVDAVVHLAAQSRPDGTPWRDLRRDNIDAVLNVLEEAVRAGVKRVVLASSNHAQNGSSVQDFAATETLKPEYIYLDGQPGSNGKHRRHTLRDTPFADSLYGVTKLLNEDLGAFFAAKHALEVVCLRIGWVLSHDHPREFIDSDPAALKRVENYVRAMYLSHRGLLRVCVCLKVSTGSFLQIVSRCSAAR